MTYWTHKEGWTPQWVVAQAIARGFRWIVTQFEDTSADVAQHLRVECASRGLAADGLPVLMCGVWESAPDYGSMLRRAEEGWQFLIEQIEGPGQHDRVLQSVGPFRDLYPDLPAAVVSNFGGLDKPELAHPLIEAGLRCVVECFVGENPMSTPARQVDFATRVLGWPHAEPMIGLGSGLTLDAYPGYQNYPGHSIWAAEYIL